MAIPFLAHSMVLNLPELNPYSPQIISLNSLLLIFDNSSGCEAINEVALYK